MKTTNKRQRPDPTIRNGRPDASIDPKNPWHRPLHKKSEPDKTQRDPQASNDQTHNNSPASESGRPVTNQDEQRKATNVDGNNNPHDENT